MICSHPGRRDDARPAARGREAPGWGYVYVMSVAGSRALKVGVTHGGRLPSARASDMHWTIGPARLRVEMAWRCSDAARLERLMHRALVAGGHRRIEHSEWFDASLPAIEHELERVAAAYGIVVEPAGLSDD